jgi:putative aldouronate transport system permease protein
MIEGKHLGNVIFHLLNHLLISALALACLLPFWIMVVSSFSSERILATKGYWVWTEEWTTEAYRWVFAGKEIQVGYQTSVFVTLVGTLGAVIVMSALGYVLAVRRFKQRRKLAFYVFFTMIFNGGMIPWFITTRNILGLRDNIWALIIPMMCNGFWVLVMRGFFESLPYEFVESALLDGASDAQILYRIVLPLSRPVLATVALFMGVYYWNDWFHGVMLLDFANFRPLSVIILSMLRNIRSIQIAMQMQGSAVTSTAQLPTYAIRMATAAITIGPIIFIVPFVQKFFIKGLTLGGLKG